MEIGYRRGIGAPAHAALSVAQLRQLVVVLSAAEQDLLHTSMERRPHLAKLRRVRLHPSGLDLADEIVDSPGSVAVLQGLG